MKFKKIIPFFIAALALMTSCADETSMTLLDEIQVSSSYVSIPVAGGSTSITVTAKDAYTVEKVTTTKNKVEWLTISAATGVAGESTLTFTASSTLDGRTAEVLIKCANKTQRVNIIQGVAKIATATCADVIAGPDSKTYQVTGVCTSIANTSYGNWYLKDNTGSIYIYGTLDAKGATKNFSSLGIEVGDEVTVQGPKTTYGTTIELVDVTVLKINKSLVKVDSVKTAALPLEGGECIAYLTCKGQGVSVDIPEDAKSWLSILSIQSAGTKTVVKFKAAANAGGDRGTTLTFTTTDGTKNYTAQTPITQKGSILNVTVAQFIAATVGTTQYRLSGVISSIADASTGKLNIKDFSGEVYVYKITDFASKNLKVGDFIIIVGQRAAYNGVAQVNNSVLETSIPLTTATVSEVLAKPDDTNTFFMVTGVIKSISTGNYGNLYLTDGVNDIYVYGCYPKYGATGNDRQGLVTAKGLKVGDTLTVIAPKGSYNGAAQLVNSFYYSHVSAQ
ncbi:MAG: hypothetical protein H6Q20_2134 [Bacteroidetes bacterium]|jgi:RPA family protein|nr:hypothetical protein [Bacteroidota bacterium]